MNIDDNTKKFNHAHVIQYLEKYYDITINNIEFLHIGADIDAKVYKADDESQSYFVKLKYGHYEDVNLAVLNFLHNSGINEVILPLLTLDNKQFQPFDKGILLVYPFINAHNGFVQALSKQQWQKLGHTLRKLHEVVVPKNIQSLMQIETFTDKWRKKNTPRRYSTSL